MWLNGGKLNAMAIEPTPRSRPQVIPGLGMGTAIGLALVLMLGIQLGGVPWRYRKQLWQLQGALAGAVVGYLVGRFSAGEGPRQS